MNGEYAVYISKLECAVIFLIFIVSFYELIGIVSARMKKLTKNISRGVTHSLICAICIILFINSINWINYITLLMTKKISSVMLVNWPFLLISITMGVITAYEFIGIYNARRFKLTKNISRLVSRGVMLLLFCGLFYLSIVKWNAYIKILEQPNINTVLSQKH